MLPKTKVIVYGLIALVVFFAFNLFNRSGKEETLPESSSSMPWKEFRDQAATFKVQLPALPQHASEAVPLPGGQGVIRYDMYLSQEKDGTTFMISRIQYPNEFDTNNSSQLLEGVLTEMMGGNTNNNLKESTKGSYRGFPSLDFLIQNNDVLIRSKTFLSNKTLYVLTLIDRNKGEIDSSFKIFSESFELLQGALPSGN